MGPPNETTVWEVWRFCAKILNTLWRPLLTRSGGGGCVVGRRFQNKQDWRGRGEEKKSPGMSHATFTCHFSKDI